MAGNDAFEKNIVKYQVYVTVCGLASTGPLCNLFYLSADISFSQLSFIEVTSLLVLTFFEVPSGALADLIGRKKNISLGCFLMGTEFILIAVGYNYQVFVLAAFIGGIGICLESGADDALLYDSLKKLNRENEFKKYLGKSNALFKMSVGITGLCSGYIYSYDQSLIFYFSGAVFLFLSAFILTTEETIDKKQKIAKKTNFIIQFLSLIKNSCQQLLNNKMLLWMLLFTGILTGVIRAHISIIRPSLLADALPNISYLGLVLAIAMTISSVISWNADRLSYRWPDKYVLMAFITIISIAFIGVGLVDGVLSIGFIFMVTVINAYKAVYLSAYWHSHFSDQERVTLSSIKQACHSLLGIFILMSIGGLTDRVGVQNASLTLGVAIVLIAILMLILKPKAQ